jgi:repressor LexA
MLTERQRRVFDFLVEFLQEKGYPPTLSEIAVELGLSRVGVMKHLITLERKGYIRRSRRARDIELIGLPRSMGVPVLGRVPAGEPLLAVENIEGMMAVDSTIARGENLFLLKVKGDSMVDAGILDGDFVLVRPQSTAEGGEIVVALIEDEATVKRFFKEPDGIRLQPENSTLSPIIVRDENVRIVGKVIGLFRQI